MLRAPSKWSNIILATALSLSSGSAAWALPPGSAWGCVDHLLREFAPSSSVRLALNGKSGQHANTHEHLHVGEKLAEQVPCRLSGGVSRPGKLNLKKNMTSVAGVSSGPIVVQAKAESKALAKLHERAANSRSISSFIDYEEMSQRCLGKKDWELLSASQKQAFVSTLQALVEKRYYPRWRKIFAKGNVVLLEESAQGKDILVRTRLKIGQKLTDLSWRVVDDGGCAKVVSLAVADRDLLEKLKARIQTHRQKGDFQSLLAWMNGKAATSAGAAVSKLPSVPTAAFAANSHSSPDSFTD